MLLSWIRNPGLDISMTMNAGKSINRWMRFREVLVITLLGWIPRIMLGMKLRNILYRPIFAHIGIPVFIEHDVEFRGASSIELESGVSIAKFVYIDAIGQQENRIYLRNRVSLQRGVHICALDKTSLDIDEDTFIGPYVCIAGPGNIKIGKNCLIAAHSGIFANNHNFDDLTRNIGDQGISRKGIVIEDNCWLGNNVTVLDGVTIGYGSVIGAGAVVTKDIAPFSIAVGVPAKLIRSRNGVEYS